MCSEPANIPIYQLSIEQSLTEEVPKVPKSPIVVNTTQQKSTIQKSVETTTATVAVASTISDEQSLVQLKRPTTLVLDCNRVDSAVASTSGCAIKNASKTMPMECMIGKQLKRKSHNQKILFRSNSSSLHKRQSTFVPAATTSAGNKFKLSSELDQIFVISSNRPENTDDEDYDSIDVIDERRMKNMPKSDRARLYKSNTFICEEYYTNEQLACVMDAGSKETIIDEKQE